MKKTIIMFVGALLLIGTSSWAQDIPKAEVFGGFSLLHVSDDDFKETPLGWQSEVTANITKMFGITGDVGGEYKTVDGTKIKIHSFLGGPQITHRLDKASVFAHAIYGLTHIGLSQGSQSDSQNNFTMGYGGGIDVKASNKVSIRVIQFDWLPTKAPAEDGGGWTKNITRFGFGVVLNVGSK